MKKLFLPLILLTLIIIIGLSLIYQKQNMEVRQRVSLAKKLGLDPRIYSRDPYFPLNYFYNILLPGMPIDQVHEKIRGYEAVYSCESSFEIYYFYNTSVDKAARMAIFYDRAQDVRQKKLLNVMTEDKNSATLPSGDCFPGLLKPTE